MKKAIFEGIWGEKKGGRRQVQKTIENTIINY